MGPALLLTILAGCTPWYGETTVARLDCTIVVTRTQVPTLRTLVENRGLERDARAFTSAVLVAP